jgi:IS1 family transposase
MDKNLHQNFNPEIHICVEKESGKTAIIKRFNNTLRQRLSHYVRKKISFSKSVF